MRYDYLLVGGGLAAASAVEGIRSRDPKGTILLVSRENYAPYYRGPLSKDLWFGTMDLDALAVHPDRFYRDHGVELLLRREIVEIDVEGRRAWDDLGTVREYGELLLATGSRPRFLGAAHESSTSVRYFRSLEDYLLLRREIERLQHVLVFAGSFIGLELATGMRQAGLEVTMLHPHHLPLQGIIPNDLAQWVTEQYRQMGVEVVADDMIASFSPQGDLIVAETRLHHTITTQLVVADAGTVPNVELAEAIGLELGNGIEVDAFGRTSEPHVFAAGDVAEIPLIPLERRARIECWEHAMKHGRTVGANMAGAEAPYDEVPAWRARYPDLEILSLGEMSTSLDVESVWEIPYQRGGVFYLRDDRLRGALLWNLGERLDWVREKIRSHEPVGREELAGAVAPA